MTVPNDIKNKIEEHDGRLQDHENRINKVETISEGLKENQNQMKSSLEKLESGFDKLENTILSQNTIMLGAFNQFITNKQTYDTEKEIVKLNKETEKKINFGDNVTKVVIQVLVLASTVIGSIWAGSKIIGQ